MSRRLLLDDEIAKELELLVSLPDDPANSEDEYESDEHGEEYNVEKLKNLLVNSESEQSSSSSNTNINIPETIPSPVTQEFPQSYKDNIESHIQNTSIEHFQISIPENPQIEMSVGQPSCSRSGISSNETIEESSEESESEGSWNKAMWSNGNRPHYSVFDKITLAPRSPISYNSRPFVYFDKFFTNEVYNLIIKQTNLYAQQQNIRTWSPTSKPEIQAFLGILITMSYHVLPDYNLYWSSDPGFRVDEIANVMSIKRFKALLRTLHLNDNSKQPQRDEDTFDKLYKVRPLVTLINEACQAAAKNTSSQSIDESMIIFKGRSSLKQYMPMKPVKRGYKVWCRCDSSTGYLYEFDIYTGKQDAGTEGGLGSKVVKKLTEKLLDMEEEKHVTFDNFFVTIIY
ncbi:unnamed protein product [Parnassius apollo]|uniref:(apollo) hypothetical protein n=1 Tax=Parnassius apollo TaxID=110799 RepID=A0A8S3WAK5_PARAO|nr:unnamed protein product [Parnassius apollo]